MKAFIILVSIFLLMVVCIASPGFPQTAGRRERTDWRETRKKNACHAYGHACLGGHGKRSWIDNLGMASMPPTPSRPEEYDRLTVADVFAYFQKLREIADEGMIQIQDQEDTDTQQFNDT